jgi:hypothetical protein
MLGRRQHLAQRKTAVGLGRAAGASAEITCPAKSDTINRSGERSMRTANAAV